MFFGYILKSLKADGYYIGHCNDIGERVREHNEGVSKYTRSRRPWELAYVRTFKTRSEAMRWEREVKKRKSKKYIQRLILEWKQMGERPVTVES